MSKRITEGIEQDSSGGGGGRGDAERKRPRRRVLEESSPSSCCRSSSAETAFLFELYRNHLDVEEDEHDLSNLEELVDTVTTMSWAVQPFLGPLSSVQSITDLLPVLVSVALHQLAGSAFDRYLAASEHDGGAGDADDGESRVQLKQVQDCIGRSLALFPRNAACWSMGANICRITETSIGCGLVGWYRRAAENARDVRRETLDVLERRNDMDESIKEWMELLILHQVVGVEYLDHDIHDGTCSNDIDGDDDEEQQDDCMGGTFSASSVEATARFMLAMLLSRDGHHQEALTNLQYIDVTHRLHPNVWTGGRTGRRQEQDGSLDATSISRSTTSTCSKARAPVSFANALPTNLYQRICQAFAPDAAFWKDSGYYNNPGYYSFLAKTHDGSKGFEDVIDEIVCGHLLPMVRQYLGKDDADKICAYEWWAHTRPGTSLGHMMHFDTDEANLKDHHDRSTTRVHHPIVSSVLHLTCDDKSGPTIILDQTPGSTELPSVCWRSVPRNNTFMIFPGDLLHGVLPSGGTGATVESQSRNDDNGKMLAASSTVELPIGEWLTPPSSFGQHHQSRRLTFMVGFKTRSVPDQRSGKSTMYGPCAPLPPATEEWVRDVQIGYSNEKTSSQSNKESNGETPRCAVFSMQDLPCVSPAWECTLQTSRPRDESGPLLQLPAIDQRFFVKGAPACFGSSLFENDDSDSDNDACDGAD